LSDRQEGEVIRLHGLRIGLDDRREELKARVAERLGVPEADVVALRIVRRSLDARHKRRIEWVYTVDVSVPNARLVAERAGHLMLPERDPLDGLVPGRELLSGRPVVVGSGPAGLFAAYVLGKYGYRPLVMDRGAELTERVRRVQTFWKGGPHDPETNLLFGEGGAGTFSDGKLLCRSVGPLGPSILRILVEHRAPEPILYDARPHVGTDRLRAVLMTLRKAMVAMGVEFRFGCRMEDLLIRDGVVTGILAGGETIRCGPLILGIGHSARDTYEMLLSRGVRISFKPFQLGVRVEHPQELIDRLQYGPSAGHPRLGPAEYALVREAGPRRRPIHSFCMCPGGILVPAVSESGRVCTNGMSYFKRNSGWANSGLVATISGGEVNGAHPLRGVEFQRVYEAAAFRLGGGTYAAPAQSIPDFIRGVVRGRTFRSTYPLGLVEGDLRDVLPPAVARAMASALKEFGRRMPGFAGDGGTVMGPETRGSCPVRIDRDPETRESVTLRGLYPVGEGAGYAGGILSAAQDGMKSALAILARYGPEWPG
jgi:uncharacterized FAD-dependent dehydrogenase